MTSKEALQDIRDFRFFGRALDNDDLLGKQCDIIEQDLEILEIIKKSFSKDFLVERLRDAYLRDDLNDEDYEKIENWEWLENDE